MSRSLQEAQKVFERQSVYGRSQQVYDSVLVMLETIHYQKVPEIYVVLSGSRNSGRQELLWALCGIQIPLDEDLFECGVEIKLHSNLQSQQFHKWQCTASVHRYTDLKRGELQHATDLESITSQAQVGSLYRTAKETVIEDTVRDEMQEGIREGVYLEASPTFSTSFIVLEIYGPDTDRDLNIISLPSPTKDNEVHSQFS
jgi:energy-coupling factor transporter ATP-binding protein EcfA2